jgi:hypothetical protein
MADFAGSFKKIIPSSGETRVLLGWGLATAALIAIEYIIFSFASGAGVSNRRLPVMRILFLGVGAYVILMIRDILAYYAGVSVDEMFTFSPVAVFGVLAFFIAFLLYALHDIQNVGASMAKSSRDTGGNLLSFFFDNEGFEAEDEEEGEPASQKSGGQGQASTPTPAPKQFLPTLDGGMNPYGMGSDPFQTTAPAATRSGSSQGQDIRDMENISRAAASQSVQQPPMAPSFMPSMTSGGSSFAPF